MHLGVDIFEDERKAKEHCKKFIEIGETVSAPPRPTEWLASKYKLVGDELWLIAERLVDDVNLLGPDEWNKVPECMFSALRSAMSGHAEGVGRLQQQQLADAVEGSTKSDHIKKKLASAAESARKHLVLNTTTSVEVRGKRAKEVVDSFLRGNLRRGYQVVSVDAAVQEVPCR